MIALLVVLAAIVALAGISRHRARNGRDAADHSANGRQPEGLLRDLTTGEWPSGYNRG